MFVIFKLRKGAAIGVFVGLFLGKKSYVTGPIEHYYENQSCQSRCLGLRNYFPINLIQQLKAVEYKKYKKDSKIVLYPRNFGEKVCEIISTIFGAYCFPSLLCNPQKTMKVHTFFNHSELLIFNCCKVVCWKLKECFRKGKEDSLIFCLLVSTCPICFSLLFFHCSTEVKVYRLSMYKVNKNDYYGISL